jgi:tryptophan synthase alpha chain
MSYVNPLMQFQGLGGRSFADSAREAGVDGILITDLPPEEPHELWATVAASGLDPILLVSPTTPPERIRAIAGRARGFVYCVSRLGVTGKGPGADERLRELVATSREHTGLPALIGFGVGGAADARRAAELADGVVVGSALLERLEAPDPVAAATALAREIRSGLTSPSPRR